MTALDADYLASLVPPGFDSVSFTGTASAPLPRPQLDAVRAVLAAARTAGADWFRFGLCINADAQAARVARTLGYRLNGYPGRDIGEAARDDIECDALEPLPPRRDRELTRNRSLAEDGDVLLVAPRQPRMILRSGTWATVRYAHRQLTPVLIALPDGRLALSSGVWNPSGTSVVGVAFSEWLEYAA